MTIAIGDRLRITGNATDSPAHDVAGVSSGFATTACGKYFATWRATSATSRDRRCKGCIVAEKAAVPESMVSCADCTLPVIANVDAVHDECLAKRCTGSAGDSCGMPVGVGCAHRDRFGNSHAPQRMGRDRRVVRGGLLDRIVTAGAA